jgi:hypothetical protein
MSLLQNRKGAMHIDLALFVVIILVLIALVLNVSKVMMVKQSLDDFSKELIRTAEVAGELGHETDTRQELLKSDLGIKPAISWDQPRGKINLNKPISVRLKLETEIGISGFLKLPIVLQSAATGYSEVYWKSELP